MKNNFALALLLIVMLMGLAGVSQARDYRNDEKTITTRHGGGHRGGGRHGGGHRGGWRR